MGRYLKRRALAELRFQLDAATMDFSDLLGDGKAEALPAVGAIDLMDLLKYARLDGLTLKWPLTVFAIARTLPESVNLMASPTSLRSLWAKRCSSPMPRGKDLATSAVTMSFLRYLE